MKERWRRRMIVESWEQERKEFLVERGIQEGEKKGIEYEVLDIGDKRKQEKERERKIRDSRYNKWYRKVRGEGMPDYLKKRMGGEKMEKDNQI